MNARKMLTPIVVAGALLVGSLAQPFVDAARAASVPAYHPGSLGNEIDPNAAQAWSGHYGPVDQSKPLDFSDQPATVPHAYVGGKLYNVQVLKQYSYAQLLNQMNYYSQSLGVGCNYCHNVQNFAYDTSTKRIARTMQIMANSVDSQWITTTKHDYPNYAVNGAVGCITCHRGKPNMAVQYNIVPIQYLVDRNKSTKMAGYVVNSMYSAAKSLGQNCLFCHNSADFVSLQYYPTNHIAKRMWAMVDDINHKYLPSNIKAVTCYTCHHGAAWPNALVTAGLDQTPVQATAIHPDVQANPGAHLDSGAAR